MKSVKNSQKGFGLFEVIIIVAVLGVLSFTVWKVWGGEKKDAGVKTAVSPAPSASPAANDEYKDWKTYTWVKGGLSFKYPANWYVEEDSMLGRVYIKNTMAEGLKDGGPSDLQALWLTVGGEEAALSHELSVKNGSPQSREARSAVRPSTIKSGSLTIATYEYETIGGSTLQAFWSNASGTRFYATNAMKAGAKNQSDMVANLKKVLATVEFKK